MYPTRTAPVRRLWAMPKRYTAFSYAPELTQQQLDTFDEVLSSFGPARLISPDGRAYDDGAYDDDAGGYAFRRAELELELESTLRQHRETLQHAFAGETVATTLVPATLREAPKKLFLLDVDSTLIQQEVIELLAAHAGRAEEVRAVTEAAMRGELDFAHSLHARVQTLAGLPEAVFAEVQAAIRLSPGAERLIDLAQAGGHKVAAVSGGFSQILAPLAARLGLDHAKANDLELLYGRLTGRVVGPVIDRAAKEQALLTWSAAEGIPLEATVVIGDGANDLDMMSAAGFSVAFNAKPKVQDAADATAWRLDLVLELAGV